MLSLPRDLLVEIPNGEGQNEHRLHLRRAKPPSSPWRTSPGTRSTSRGRRLPGLRGSCGRGRRRLPRHRPPLLQRELRHPATTFAEINLKPGYQKMDGKSALAVRALPPHGQRHPRAARQQDFLPTRARRSTATCHEHDKIIDSSPTTSVEISGAQRRSLLLMLCIARATPDQPGPLPGRPGPSTSTASPEAFEGAVAQFLGIERATVGARSKTANPKNARSTSRTARASRKESRAARRRSLRQRRPARPGSRRAEADRGRKDWGGSLSSSRRGAGGAACGIGTPI